MYSKVHRIERRQYTYSQITTAYTSEHSRLTQLSAKAMQKVTEMLTSNITSDLPPRSEEPHDHTIRETIRRENLAADTSELYRL